MGGGPGGYGGPGMMRPPLRQGTSKAVPVVVSAGLAVGVFCGLLFGLGTGDEATASTPTEKKFVGEKNPTPEDTTPQGGSFVAPPKSVTDGTATPTAPATGSATPPATGSAAPVAKDTGSAAPVVPAVKAAKLTIDIKPESVAATAKITVDGKDVTLEKTTVNDKEVTKPIEIELGDQTKKEVTVIVKASGYKEAQQKIDVDLANDTTLQIELIKRGGTPKRPDSGGDVKPPKRPKKPPGGGLIDI
jgi:hypothetical protein